MRTRPNGSVLRCAFADRRSSGANGRCSHANVPRRCDGRPSKIPSSSARANPATVSHCASHTATTTVNCRLRIEYVALVMSVSTLVLGSCARAPVTWSEVTYAAPPRPVIQPGRVVPPIGACPVFLRSVRKAGITFAAWWSVRADSSALLVVGQSRDRGQSWMSQVVADSTDRSTRGCGRPAPAIAVDSATNYVHLAYFAEPPSGSGIFFAHSMDGGRTFHAAVPIVFGENSAFVGVAASGDRVAVAYEDPNSLEPSVGVALSHSMGHIFEDREMVSNENERARQPAVEVRGDSIRLWWSDYSADPRMQATRTAYRAGLWR